MKIAVFGSGAVGGYIGGRLAQDGHDVTFIARGPHLQAILTQGLSVSSISGDFTVHPAKAFPNPHEIGAVDLVLCCVKSWQLSQIVRDMQPLMGPETVVIPIQNGVEAHTTLSRTLHPEQILPGLCRIISFVEAPGRIRHAGADPYLAFGELNGRKTPRVENVARAFAGSQGLTVEVSQDILADLWKKFMLIAPWGVSALSPVRQLPLERKARGEDRPE